MKQRQRDAEPTLDIVEDLPKAINLQEVVFIHLNRIMRLGAGLYLEGGTNTARAFSFSVQMLESLNAASLKNNEKFQDARAEIFEKYKGKTILRTRKHFELIMDYIDIERNVVISARTERN